MCRKSFFLFLSDLQGRKSRRERRIIREKKLLGRGRSSPLSFASRSSPSYNDYVPPPGGGRKSSSSSSRSPSPANKGKVEYITSFGGDSDEDTKKKSSTVPEASKKAQQQQANKERLKRLRKTVRSPSPEVFMGPELPAHLRLRKESPRSR